LLTGALEEAPGLAGRFHELVALVQAGHSLADIRDLHAAGFLDPEVRIPAPGGAPAWEVREVRVKPGEMVEPGTVLAVLANPERVALEIAPPGVDIALVDRALRSRTPLEARPLLEGEAPPLEGIRLEAFRGREGTESGPRAFAVVRNEAVLHEADGKQGPRRTWALRPGMRYMVRLPVRSIPDAFVLPRRAVVKDGLERVVFLRSGDGFRRQPVRIVHEDREAAVAADDGSLFPGDPVVVTGAFSIALALRAEGAETGEHKHGAT
jgi:hypothetical protein